VNSTEATRERIDAALEGLEYRSIDCADGMPCIQVDRDVLLEALSRLKEQAAFETVTFVTAVDHLKTRSARAPEPRFELDHQLHSIEHADRIRIKTLLHSDDASAPSCTALWPGASFMERECFDMFGIRFDGHPNLKRLMMPDGYGHHPLRKDFPHKGIEPDRLYREWDRQRRLDEAAAEGGGR